MQPFELPEFYMPWPARLNPNLEAARTHSKKWAYEVGILSSEEDAEDSIIWDECTFDAHDYALLCAYIHPDAPEAELNLITNWYVWIFFFDDHFLTTFKKTHDMEGANKYLDRLPVFMPIQPTEELPTPITPVERGLANLWPLTAFTKSEEWRLRFFESTQNQFDSSLCELANINQNRVSNPVEYVELRRMVGGAPWSADLTEHAVFMEIPTQIVSTRPMRVLKDTFSDAVHFHNDLFSYQREVEEEGENSNCVLVLKKFFNVDTQTAANITNDLLTSRVQQFEHTVITELPLLFGEYLITPEEQVSILSYVKALRDWLSGSHEWHMRSSRYMNKKSITSSEPTLALGIFPELNMYFSNIDSLYNTFGFRSKNYTHTPHESLGDIKLPKFYMPFSTQANSNVDAVRRHSKKWAVKMGILNLNSCFFETYTWDERKFDAADLAFLSALIHPDASITQLNLTAYWMVWGTYFDDYLPAVYGKQRNMPGAKLFIARLLEIIQADSSVSAITPINPVECGLIDLWSYISDNLSANAQNLFRNIFDDMTKSWLWELSNHIQNRIPEPIDYVEMRRKSFAWDLIKLFTQIEKSINIPADVYRTQTMCEINNSAADCAWITNDIFSYKKEIEFEGELNNGVLVTQRFLDCDSKQAIEILNNLMTSRVSQFEHLIATELTSLFKQFDLDETSRQSLLDYIESLQFLMSSNFQWHLKADRYKESELKNEQIRSKRSIANPVGLGVSAAQVTTLLKTEKTKSTPPTEALKSDKENPNTLGTSAIRVIDLLKEIEN